MSFVFSQFKFKYDTDIAKKACGLFEDEIKSRVLDFSFKGETVFEFKTIPDSPESEAFSVDVTDKKITVCAHRLRGFIYGYSMFLRKSEIKDGQFVLKEDISESYSPAKKIRGHQLGYRNTNNTCDAWNAEQYRRYILDLMMFGLNTFEGICDYEEQNCLMPLSIKDMFTAVSAVCDELDVDVSVWHPTYSKETEEDIRAKIYDFCFFAI